MANREDYYHFSDEDEQEDNILYRAYDQEEQYYDFSNEEEEEDSILNRAFDRWVQMRGGGAARMPLFQFTMKPVGRRRTWRNVVERAQFHAQLRQLRQVVPGDDIGLALTESLYEAIENELLKQERPAHHFVNMAITANGFHHAYQSANFTVGEFLQGSTRMDEMLSNLANKLNSNQSFNIRDGFNVQVVFVALPGPASGHRKKHNPGRMCLDRENKKKRCIITIKNTDQLCCARAIVTMRAFCHKNDGMDGFRQWENLKRGLPMQEHKAKELHR